MASTKSTTYKLYPSYFLATLAEALKSGDSFARIEAIQALRACNDEGAAEILVEALSDSNREVALSAAQALQGNRSTAIVRLCTDALGSATWQAREAAAISLKGTRETSALAALVKALSDSMPSVSQAAALSLQGTRDNEVLRSLLHTLSDYNFGTRYAAALALKRAAVPEIVLAVVSLLQSSSDTDTREAAAIALKDCVTKDGLDALTDGLRNESARIRQRCAEGLEDSDYRAAVPRLLTLLSDPNSAIRRAAMRTLHGMVPYASLPRLCAVLAGDESSSVRRAALRALAPFAANEQVGECMRRVLPNDKEQEVREAAAHALSSLSDIRSREVLLEALLIDGSGRVRVAALRALARHTGDIDVRRAIAARLTKDSDPRVREEAALVLQGTRDEFCLSLLVHVLADPAWRDTDTQVRLACANALEKCNTSASYEALAKALGGDVSPAVRRRAAAALIKRRDETALRALHLALSDSDMETRLAAVRAFSGCAEHTIVISLAALLERDEEWQVRRAAAESLRGLEESSATKALLQALFDASPHVRLAAAEALQGVSDQKVLQRLLKVVSSSRMERYRFFAARALQRTANPEIIRSLAELCNAGGSTTIREAAAFALGRRGQRVTSSPKESAAPD
jgi:HEAT repeat protein